MCNKSLAWNIAHTEILYCVSGYIAWMKYTIFYPNVSTCKAGVTINYALLKEMHIALEAGLLFCKKKKKSSL